MKLSRSALSILLPATTLTLLATGPASGQAVKMLWQRLAPGIPEHFPAYSPTDTLNSNPYILVYQAPQPVGGGNGAAAVICPGGGYTGLSILREGVDIAKWLNKYGITCFVLRYRLGSNTGTGPFRHPAEMWDAQRAIRWVRANAAAYAVNVSRVGIVGFSAGGHLASTAATHYDAGNPGSGSADSIDNYPGTHDSVDNFSCRPDFQILAYPVINMDSSIAHAGSRDALLGTNPAPSAALKTFMSSEKQVTANTPPAFLVHGNNDGTVPVRNSQAYSDSLQKRGVTHKLLIYANGPHGFGLADGKDGAPATIADLAKWPDSAITWLRSLGFLTETSAIFNRTGFAINHLGRGVFMSAELGRLGFNAWNILGRRLPPQNRVPFMPLAALPQ